ncbi:hypothetical protein T4B_13904 [Trichinella pseudospiralis]|uniref:Uncharacterized protein n=1 Tax=Trichinella pseudospiralis TaxID=6337 RepID=A0A0V1EXB9_TRIPS|nr:hypothetical protein T4A_4871 [Trichinella pseudospiralis]KRZ31753.1 hypothetical protein T4B_13904 [Trichinella pseudospiralis]KRZ45047.1 hypothetical protein T4C_3257 [Trichinella pseudospiralis]
MRKGLNGMQRGLGGVTIDKFSYASVRSSSKEQRFSVLLIMAVNIVRKVLEKRQFDLPMRTFLLLCSFCAVDGNDSVKMAIKTDRPA